MAKIFRISYLCIVFALFFIVLFLSSCAKSADKTASGESSQMLELKKTACYSAAAGNCAEKLSGSEVVSAEQCCELFNKCC
jgi:hypothetical protein